MKTASRFEQFPAYSPVDPLEVLAQRLGRPLESIIKLDANENPYGPSPRARRALQEITNVQVYPDPESRALRLALAAFTSLPQEYLLAGSGADELIDLLLRVVLEPGDRVLNCPPTFGMYEFNTRLNHGRVLDVPRRADFSLDLPAIQRAVLAQQPKVLFLAAPNNPDGGLPSSDEMETLLSLPLLVVLDEAYIEFTQDAGRLGEARSLIRQVPQRDNLVVLRTFSKWAGLAGLRVGYGAFPQWLLPDLWKAKQPYNVNCAASAAAMASLEDADVLADHVQALCAERQRLFGQLAALPFLQPFPTQGNFILCRVHGLPARRLRDLLAERGIVVRFYDTPLLQDAIRISVGLPQNSDALMAALQEIGAVNLEHLVQLQGRQISAQPPEVAAAPPAQPGGRSAHVQRKTTETQIELDLALDGGGRADIQTGLPFLDHMLTQVALHGLFDLTLRAAGDLAVDAHHTLEDTALALGEGFDRALGERRGIVRMSASYCPMDESLARVVVDLSGRPYAVIQGEWATLPIGGLAPSLIVHFLERCRTQ